MNKIEHVMKNSVMMTFGFESNQNPDHRDQGFDNLDKTHNRNGCLFIKQK